MMENKQEESFHGNNKKGKNLQGTNPKGEDNKERIRKKKTARNEIVRIIQQGTNS